MCKIKGTRLISQYMVKRAKYKNYIRWTAYWLQQPYMNYKAENNLAMQLKRLLFMPSNSNEKM